MSISIGTPEELGIDVQRVSSFYEKNWPRKIALANAQFYQWQFIDTPNKAKDSCCIALKDSEIIAVMGLHERDFLFRGKALEGAELTTWIVKQDKRNLGVGPKMLDYLQSKYSVLTGMGISEQALPVYLRKGFKYIKSIPRFVKILNENSVKRFGVHSPVVTKLCRLKVAKVPYSAHSLTEDVANEINDRFAATSNLFNRRYDWLSWRYNNHPTFNYVSKVIGFENFSCVVVYRVDKLDEVSVMHGLDLYGDKEAFPSAISYLEDEAERHGVDIADLYSTHTTLNAYFTNRNWLPVLDYDFFDFPHLFHPVEMRKPSTTSLIFWNKQEDPKFYDLGCLYITKQDCDFDRPTALNLNGDNS